MANLDNPHGFIPVQKYDGSPWNAMVRSALITDAVDLFTFDALGAASGRAQILQGDNDAVLGVAVGFGKNNTVTGTMGSSGMGMMFNPDDLLAGSRYYADGTSTHTEWNVFYVNAYGTVFQAQCDGAAPGITASYDLTLTAGDTASGISKQEVDSATPAAVSEGVFVIDFVRNPDNDVTAVNAEVLVKFNLPTAQAA